MFEYKAAIKGDGALSRTLFLYGPCVPLEHHLVDRLLPARRVHVWHSEECHSKGTLEMRNATRVTVSTFGAIAGLAGIEHGIGEVRQGNVAPDELMILSWPDSEVFAILAGEPAMTIVPNLLITGILTILFSLLFLVWATMFIGRKHGGLVLILLSVALLLVGGGLGPPILGVIVGFAATRINAPPAWWCTHLSDGARRLLAMVWSPCLVVGVTAWLLVMPGTLVLDFFIGVNIPDFVVYGLTLCAFGLLLLTVFTGFAHDTQRQQSSQQTPTVSG
jgi:hypothetical protein